MSYENYGKIVRIVRKLPYFLRRFFWMQLYYYNINKYDNLSIKDLDLYISYANDT